MFGVLDFDTAWRVSVGGLSLLAALHYAGRYPDELHQMLERYRRAVQISLATRRPTRKALAALAFVTGLTISMAMPMLYLLHFMEAMSDRGHTEVVRT